MKYTYKWPVGTRSRMDAYTIRAHLQRPYLLGNGIYYIGGEWHGFYCFFSFSCYLQQALVGIRMSYSYVHPHRLDNIVYDDGGF